MDKSNEAVEGKTHDKSTTISWFIIAFLVAIILIKGFFAFFVVGNLGQPDWDFGIIPDVPASSPYAVYSPLPYPQHIEGKEGK